MSTDDASPSGPGGSPDDDRFWLPLVERRILDAMDRGEFDNLPGAGKPIPDVDVFYDPGWWVRKWIRREHLRDLSDELRRSRADELLRVRASREADAARHRLERLDARIAEVEWELSGRRRSGAAGEVAPDSVDPPGR
jgi:hypothetical protein